MLRGRTCYCSVVVVFLVTSLASIGDGRRPPRGVAGRVPGLPSYVTVDGFNMARDGLRPMYTAPDDTSRMPGRYVVVMKDTSDSDAVQHVMGKYKSTVLAAQREGRRRGHPDVISRFHMETVAMEMNVLKGFVAEMTPDDVMIMRTMSDVEYVEEDQVFEKQQSAHAHIPWHLDRIDQQDLPLDGQFNRQPVSQTLDCPSGYQLFADACFKAFDEAKDYSTAEAACATDGGIVAEPRNRAVNDILIKLKTSLNPRVRFWLGLTDREKEGTWRWNDGEELDRSSFTSWADGEPNQAGNEDCAVVEVDSKWNDVPCRLKYRFICQRPAYITKQVYIGCYRDGGSLDIRDLTGDVMKDEENLTPTSCLSHCTSAGYRYAGLQYGKECFCGDNFGGFGAAPESECNKPCSGDAAKTCGGDWRNSIYRTITGYIKQKNQIYKVYSDAKTYTAAGEVCAADGGRLADVRTEAVHDFLVRAARVVDPGRDYWIGLNDQEVEGSWVWSDGDPLGAGDFASWAAGEPNNREGGQLGIQNCGQLWASRGFLWDDDSCDQEDYFLCQVSLAPKKWREDGRCGQGYPAEDGRPAECNPDSGYPCCSSYNYCGNTTDHCECQDCVDYRNTDSVDVYIVDSGIRYSHEEFEGRADWSGFDAHDADGSNKGNDLEGHGTHVAALVGGRTFGVNPRVLLRSVRVLDNRGRGSTFTVIGGLNHIYDKITSNNGARGVVVMSLGSAGVSRTVNQASRELVLLGLPVVVAAGNDGGDACSRSPAGEAEVITVGGTRRNDQLYDRTGRSPPGGATAHGSCVDIFAPAQEVLSAGAECDSCSAVLSGTSQAAPITAGVVTTLLSRDPSMTPAQIRMTLLSTAATNKLDLSPLPEDSRLKTPNKLLQVPTAPLDETAACRTVWSLRSDTDPGSVASAACNVNETMMSCSSLTDGVRTGEFPLDIPNGRQICVAQNGEDGSSVYALARCCILPGRPKCYFKTSERKSPKQDDTAATVTCDQSPGDVLTGCSASAGGSPVGGAFSGNLLVPDRILQRCSAWNSGGGVEAHAFCCQGGNMDCWLVHSDEQTDEVATVSCPGDSVLTGCNALSSGGRAFGARSLDRTCIAHRDPSAAQGVSAHAICCSVDKR
ncbi:PCSK9 [Branchiostoma lanceolatum]|uniref:Proprotein convertase subtilisin/kexin type 9 n=1 Tax=Branchiostoma lanceolatum TaxID=7740 RepID=A0A8K0E9J7_BRALA|nr:PCSK9 [Branchiostoma lanceolatum]